MNKLLIFFLLFLSHPAIGQNTNRIKGNLLNGKPISFYLNSTEIDKNSKMYYNGQFSATVDSITFSILDSLLTKNNQTRPFYLFVFNQIMKVSDGALSEYMSDIAAKYFELYPCDFFEVLSLKEYSVDTKTWALFVGFSIHSRQPFNEFVVRIEKKLKSNCKNNMNSWAAFKIEMEKNLQDENTH